MIVFELLCSLGHRFDSWFQSGAAFDRQQAAGVITCPLCGGNEVTKALMAPHVARSGTVSTSSGTAASDGAERERPNESGPASPVPAGMMRMLQQFRRQVEADCDYVGPSFPEEARRIHYGEAPARGIYGEASDEEAAALRDEGVEARRIPWFPRRDD